MAGPEEILIKIAMSGEGDVVARLESVGKAGEDAFSKLEKAFVDSAGIFTGLIAGIAGVGAGLLEWSKHSANVTTSLSNLAAAAGDTIEGMSGLEGALSSMGASTEFLAGAYRRLSFTIESEWQQIRRTVKTESDKLISDQLAVQASALSVQSAEMSLAKARQALAADQGVVTDPQVLAMQKRQQLIQAVAEAELKVQEAQQKRVETAKKADEDRKNSLASVGDAVQKVATGQESLADASQHANLEINNVIKGIVLAAGPSGAEQATEGLKDFKGSLADIGTAAPPVQAVFFKLADFMKNSGDAALNTALSYRLLSRGVGQDVVQAMSKGSEAIKKEIADAQALGLTLTKTDEDIAKAFKSSFNSLSSTLSVTLTQIGNLFGPAFTEGMNLLNTAIKNNHAAIIAWANGVANQAAPVIKDFFRAISGNGADIETPWIKSLTKAIGEFYDWLVNTVVPGAKKAFRVMGGDEPVPQWIKDYQKNLESLASFLETLAKTVGTILGGIAKAINATFGTEIDGAAVLAGLWVAKMLGVFSLLSIGIKAFMGAFAASLVPAGTSVAVFAGLVIARFALIAAAIAAAYGLYTLFTSKAGRSESEAVAQNRAEHQAADTEANLKFKRGELGDLSKPEGLDAARKELERLKEQNAADAKTKLDAALKKVRETQAEGTEDVATKEFDKATKKAEEFAAKINGSLNKVDSSKYVDELKKAGQATDDLANKSTDKPKAPGSGSSEISGLVTKESVGKQVITMPGATGPVEPLTAKVVLGELATKGKVIETPPGSLDKGVGVRTVSSVAEQTARARAAELSAFGGEGGGLEGARKETEKVFPGVDAFGGTGGPTTPATPSDALKTSSEQAASSVSNMATQISGLITGIDSLRGRIDQLFTSPLGSGGEAAPLGGAEKTEDQGAEKLDSTLMDTDSTLERTNSVFDNLTGTVTQLASAIQTVASSTAGAALGGLIQAFAGGGAVAGHNPISGLVRGPGTGTSDSIIARVSNGEYVMRSAAVSHYGVQNMHAINKGAYPKFSLGGLIDGMSAGPMPNFSAGGPVSTAAPAAGHPVTLVIGGDKFEGLTATPHAAKQLQSYAVQKRISTSGKKPIWYD